MEYHLQLTILIMGKLIRAKINHQHEDYIVQINKQIQFL